MDSFFLRPRENRHSPLLWSSQPVNRVVCIRTAADHICGARDGIRREAPREGVELSGVDPR